MADPASRNFHYMCSETVRSGPTEITRQEHKNYAIGQKNLSPTPTSAGFGKPSSAISYAELGLTGKPK